MTEIMLRRIQVREQVSRCTVCGLHQTATAPVPFSGPSPADVCVVGEAPGRQEDKAGQPFVGPSGDLVRQTMESVGFRVSESAFLNAVSCFPDRTPTKEEVVACKTNLINQLEAISPKFVLVLGGVAVSALCATPVRMGDVRGSWFRPSTYAPLSTTWCLATWHPAAVLRNRALEEQWREDLLYAKLVITKADPELSSFCLKCKDPRVDWYDDLPFCKTHAPKGRKNDLSE